MFPYLKAIGEAAEAAYREAAALRPEQACSEPHERRKLDLPRGGSAMRNDWFSSNLERIRRVCGTVSV